MLFFVFLAFRYADCTAKRVELDLEEEFRVPSPVGVRGLEDLPDEEEDEVDSGEAAQRMRERMVELMNSKG